MEDEKKSIDEKMIREDTRSYIIKYSIRDLDRIIGNVKTNGFTEDPKVRMKIGEDYLSLIRYTGEDSKDAEKILDRLGIDYERDQNVYSQR